ncbi:Histidine kinase [Pseudomonas sp. E141]|uniref:sensor histidine kinase n=1 Tax=Pseudomonas sp. E141 TaxID=2875961 RepID=UPI00404566F6
MPFVKRTWRNSISFKVLLAYVVGVGLSILLIALGVLALVTSKSDILLTTDVAERTHELAGKLQFDATGRPNGFDSSEGDRVWTFDSLGREIGHRVLDSTGNVVLTSTDATFWSSVASNPPSQQPRFKFEREGIVMYAATAAVEHQGKTWYLQFSASERLMDLLHGGFALPFMGAGIALFSLVLLFVFGACAYFTLGYTLKPLREVSESAAAISPRSLHSRLQVKTVPSEVEPLVTSFNQALARLERGYRVQQEFLATAAHELKTPLALIRAQIELMQDSHAHNALLDDVAHMTRQVQQLLLLTEASEVQNYSFATVEIADVAREACGYLQRMAEAVDIRLVLVDETPDGGQWQADRSALFTLLKNLLENAIQHAPRGTEVRMHVSAGALRVRDWGPGVDREQLPHLFTRFWRGPHRRDHGAGLGLTICQEIARAHGWMLSAKRAEPGLLFELSWPQRLVDPIRV